MADICPKCSSQQISRLPDERRNAYKCSACRAVFAEPAWSSPQNRQEAATQQTVDSIKAMFSSIGIFLMLGFSIAFPVWYFITEWNAQRYVTAAVSGLLCVLPLLLLVVLIVVSGIIQGVKKLLGKSDATK